MAVGTTDRPQQRASPAVRAARTLGVDRVTAEVVSALDAAAIRSILLKGPSIGRWLYAAGGRSYDDTDLLVAGEQFEHAAEVLAELGFTDVLQGFRDFERDAGAVENAYIRRPLRPNALDEVVDLHRNLADLCPSDHLLWETLAAETATMSVGGVEVQVLNRTGLALHVVVHAVQHDFRSHTGEDLRRATVTCSVDDWRRVAAMASSLGIDDVFGFGIRHTATGADVAAQLCLPTMSTIALDRRARPRGATALDLLRSARTLQDVRRWVQRALFPSRAKLRFAGQVNARDRWTILRAYGRRWRETVAEVRPSAVWAFTRRREADAGRAEQDASSSD